MLYKMKKQITIKQSEIEFDISKVINVNFVKTLNNKIVIEFEIANAVNKGRTK